MLYVGREGPYVWCHCLGSVIFKSATSRGPAPPFPGTPPLPFPATTAGRPVLSVCHKSVFLRGPPLFYTTAHGHFPPVIFEQSVFHDLWFCTGHRDSVDHMTRYTKLLNRFYEILKRYTSFCKRCCLQLDRLAKSRRSKTSSDRKKGSDPFSSDVDTVVFFWSHASN